jgi:hypothetical protein
LHPSMVQLLNHLLLYDISLFIACGANVIREWGIKNREFAHRVNKKPCATFSIYFLHLI